MPTIPAQMILQIFQLPRFRWSNRSTDIFFNKGATAGILLVGPPEHLRAVRWHFGLLASCLAPWHGREGSDDDFHFLPLGNANVLVELYRLAVNDAVHHLCHECP